MTRSMLPSVASIAGIVSSLGLNARVAVTWRASPSGQLKSLQASVLFMTAAAIKSTVPPNAPIILSATAANGAS